MRIQRVLDSDIVMIFDECTPYPATEDVARASMELSLRWAERSKRAHEGNDAALFGIVQGGVHRDAAHAVGARGCKAIGFDGYAIGGLAVGEPEAERNAMLEHTCPQLPADRPRYLMGVGRPEDLVEAVARGVDMFDCVMPTRNARNGHFFTRTGSRAHPQRAVRDGPAPDRGGLRLLRPAASGYSRAYLRHLDRCNEMLAPILGTLHNLWHYEALMADMRAAIGQGTFAAFRDSFHAGRAWVSPCATGEARRVP